MQFHQIISKTKFRKGRRIGRGGKRGTYSGRGIKGQKARAGHKIRPAVRDLLKKIPKLRGYKFKSFRPKPITVNLGDIDKKFKSGDSVTPESLLEVGLISRIKGRIPKVKILGRGELKKKFVFRDVLFSQPVLRSFGIESLKPKAQMSNQVPSSKSK